MVGRRSSSGLEVMRCGSVVGETRVAADVAALEDCLVSFHGWHHTQRLMTWHRVPSPPHRGVPFPAGPWLYHLR